MDRMDPDCRSFSFDERQRHYRNLVRNWTACIETLKPELVISATIPHRVYDYVLYLLCQRMRIPFIMFQHTAFPGRIMPLQELNSIDPEIKQKYDNISAANPNFSILKENLSPDILAGYQNVQKDYEQGQPAYMKTNELLHRQSSSTIGLSIKFVTDIIHSPAKYFGRKGYLLQGFPTYLKEKNKSIESSRLGIIRYSLNKVKTNKLKRELKKYYDSLTERPDFRAPYIFVPLHYQPEMTSNPAGDIFVDQFLCVETLAKNIPQGWMIYVKEHPAQFQFHGEGQTSRSRGFYDDLLKFPNVRLIPFQADSFSLISEAKAIATISGTVGWEAMVRRKPVLIFGLSWYECYPGVLKISTEEEAGELYDFIQNFTYNETQLMAYLTAFEKSSFRAYYFRGLKEKMHQTEMECVENLVVEIMRHVNP
jgi:hypothetical protein